MKNKRLGKILVVFLVLALVGGTVFWLRNYPLKTILGKEKLYYSILSSVKKPQFPNRQCNIADYGAVADGQTKNTGAIAKAIDDCAQKGGGTVSVPKGLWLTGPIRFKDNIDLNLEEGAELKFSDDRSDYLPLALSRYQGMELYNFSPLIDGVNCTNIAITGQGKLNGNGEAWIAWNRIHQKVSARTRLYQMIQNDVPVEQRIFGEQDEIRPSFIQFINSKNILLEGVTIEDSPMWTIHPIYSENITISNVTVNNSGTNTDDVDIDSSRDVLIENSHFASGDDDIAIKSGLEKDGWRVNRPSENIVIRNCAMTKGHTAVAIGSEMSGDVRNVIIKNNSFSNTNYGFRVKSLAGRGGVVENIWLDNTNMKGVWDGISLDMTYPSRVGGKMEHIPTFQNVLISDINMTNFKGAKKTLVIDSLGEEYIKNINITNLNSSSHKISVKNAKEVWINNSNIHL